MQANQIKQFQLDEFGNQLARKMVLSGNIKHPDQKLD